jgi:lysophospholipase L1-like esterase
MENNVRKSNTTRCLNFIIVCLVAPFLSAEEAVRDTKAVGGGAANSVRLILPKTIPAAVGIECNLYFENVVLAARPGSLLFDTVCPKGRQQVERWTWVPTEADVGSHPLELIIRDENNHRLASAACTIDVAPPKRGEGKTLTMLMIGDSLTHASVYPQRVVEQSEKMSGPKVTLIGSHTPQPASPLLRHEGYGGWTAKRFATYFTETARTGEYAKRGSPFLYRTGTESPHLDFVAYCRDMNEGRFPDVVSIFLGPNDIFSFNDETIEAGIDDMLKHLELLLKMISDASPSTKIALLSPVPPAASQDAFGSNYASGQTRWQYRRNQHRLVERIYEQFANPLDNSSATRRLFIVPTDIGLDCVNNYPTETVLANATTDIKIVRQSNGVHPAGSGYNQIGDMLFAWLKNQASE